MKRRTLTLLLLFLTPLIVHGGGTGGGINPASASVTSGSQGMNGPGSRRGVARATVALGIQTLTSPVPDPRLILLQQRMLMQQGVLGR